MQNEISQSEKSTFLTESALFIEEFEPEFSDYFLSLCKNYHCVLLLEEKRSLAHTIYHNVFSHGLDMMEFKNDIFTKMPQDGVMIGFLLNRSMFFLLENYIDFTKHHHLLQHVEVLIACITRVIQVFEHKISDKMNLPLSEFDITFNESSFITNNIIDVFKIIKQDKQGIRFLNLYQGVPISYDAQILEIENGTVTFSMDRLQEIAMKLDGNAFIVKNKYFSKHIKADILYNDFSNNTVTLHNFIYLLNMPAIQREYIRVHPDIIAKVYLNQGDTIQISGRLYDLSMKGLGVVSHENNGVVIGAKVLVSFDLNAVPQHDGDTIEVDAEVINIIEYKDSYRYCMRIFPEQKMSQKISTYIVHREEEIIENLKDELKEYIL